MTTSNLDLARECGAETHAEWGMNTIRFKPPQLDAFAERIRELREALAAAPAQPVAFPAGMPEPSQEYAELPEPNSYCTYSDSHEYDVFDAEQMHAYADATHALRTGEKT